ncbi:hypothetical protein PIB30_085859 [Stylosanthes scabra]|uniref:Secreted protein n=1 Tax=Stylosanthes scabra TaxID=79078 RepID=A0ABU6ZRK9_9FABA|nr:hypothetical protein [Stylosanthes scabra]
MQVSGSLLWFSLFPRLGRVSAAAVMVGANVRSLRYSLRIWLKVWQVQAVRIGLEDGLGSPWSWSVLVWVSTGVPLAFVSWNV